MGTIELDVVLVCHGHLRAAQEGPDARDAQDLRRRVLRAREGLPKGPGPRVRRAALHHLQGTLMRSYGMARLTSEQANKWSVAKCSLDDVI